MPEIPGMLWLLALAALVVVVALRGAASDRFAQVDDWRQVPFPAIVPYAQRAAAAYDTDDQIRAAYGPDVFVATTPTTSVKFFLETNEAERWQWLAVRGTDDLTDIKVDADLGGVPDPRLGVRLHKGFHKAALEVYDLVRPRLRPDHLQRLTGHSLGAAVSLILQGYLDAEGFRVERSFNFGQPKITNEEGVKRLQHLRVLRLVNDEDPVPFLPPTLPELPRDVYRHVGPEAVLESPPAFLFFTRHNAERLAVSGFWDHLGHEAPSAHRCAAYLDKLRQLVVAERDRRRGGAGPTLDTSPAGR